MRAVTCKVQIPDRRFGRWKAGFSWGTVKGDRGSRTEYEEPLYRLECLQLM